MTYSTDLRKRVLKYVEDGGSKEDAVNIFGVCIKTIWNWIKRNKQGNLSPKIKEVHPRKIDDDRFKNYIENHPDAYLREIAAEFDVTVPAVFYACKRLRLTLKKKTTNYQERDEEKREIFLKKLENIPEEKCVYIDESGIDKFVFRAFGRAPIGKIIPFIKNNV